jgi:hypothetical protein
VDRANEPAIHLYAAFGFFPNEGKSSERALHMTCRLSRTA